MCKFPSNEIFHKFWIFSMEKIEKCVNVPKNIETLKIKTFSKTFQIWETNQKGTHWNTFLVYGWSTCKQYNKWTRLTIGLHASKAAAPSCCRVLGRALVPAKDCCPGTGQKCRHWSESEDSMALVTDEQQGKTDQRAGEAPLQLPLVRGHGQPLRFCPAARLVSSIRRCPLLVLAGNHQVLGTGWNFEKKMNLMSDLNSEIRHERDRSLENFETSMQHSEEKYKIFNNFCFKKNINVGNVEF